MRNYLFIFLLISFVACRQKTIPLPMSQPKPVQILEKPREVSLELAAFKAYDIQENLSLHDELWVEYNLVAIKSGRILRLETSSRYLGKIKQGASVELDSIPALRLQLNPGEQLGVQVSLWEIDDYSKDLNVLRKVNNWGGMIQIPLMLVEWSSVSNPLSWFLWGTRLGAVGLSYWSEQDGRDLIGVSELQWDWASLPKGKTSRFKRGNWKGGRTNLNGFQYGYSYRIRLNE
jgi:hypothetical protein